MTLVVAVDVDIICVCGGQRTSSSLCQLQWKTLCVCGSTKATREGTALLGTRQATSDGTSDGRHSKVSAGCLMIVLVATRVGASDGTSVDTRDATRDGT